MSGSIIKRWYPMSRRRKAGCIPAAALLFLGLAASAGQSGDERAGISTGASLVERKPVGVMEVLAPADAEVKRERQFVVVESQDEYMARKFSGLNDRITVLEREVSSLREKVEALSEDIKAPDGGQAAHSISAEGDYGKD